MLRDELAPTMQQLKERAEYYRRRAADERDQGKAAGYLQRARIIEEAVTPLGPTPLQQAELDRAEHDVREGEKRVARQLALVKRLDAEGRYARAGKRENCLGYSQRRW